VQIWHILQLKEKSLVGQEQNFPHMCLKKPGVTFMTNYFVQGVQNCKSRH